MHPQVFSTSRCLSPPVTFLSLFHLSNALGVLLFRGFPPLVAERLSARRAPHDVVPKGTAFRGLSSQRIRAHIQRSMKSVERPILS